MISRKHRFHGLGSLKPVYQRGKATRGPLFSVKSLLNPKRRDFRLAVVVSRKVHKSAVARNRMRRRLYAAAWTFKDDIVEPHDIVITVFSEALLELPADELTRQVKKQLADAGILVKRIKS